MAALGHNLKSLVYESKLFFGFLRFLGDLTLGTTSDVLRSLSEGSTHAVTPIQTN